MRIMIRSYSEKCQVHDVESAADTEISLSHISHSSAGVLQYCSILIMILLVLAMTPMSTKISIELSSLNSS